MGNSQCQRQLPRTLNHPQLMSLVRPINTSLCLEKLCESNYQKLFTLIPNLCALQDIASAHIINKPSLYLKIIDRTRHTLTLELRHEFIQLPTHSQPSIQIRVYLDANLAEALKDYARPFTTIAHKDPSRSVDIMNYKWRLNYFLGKWLDYCLLTEYKFKNTVI